MHFSSHAKHQHKVTEKWKKMTHFLHNCLEKKSLKSFMCMSWADRNRNWELTGTGTKAPETPQTSSPPTEDYNLTAMTKSFI